MLKALTLEFFKLRRSWIFTMITLFIGAEFLWASLSVSIALSRHPDSNGWETLLVTVASMNSLFLPILAAIVSSRICDMEHKGDTWKLVLPTSLKLNQIYAAKYGCSCILMLYAALLQTLAITCYGITKGLPPPVPFAWFPTFIIGTMVTSMAILAVQQWVSLSLKNQAFALSLGMVGGFLGLTGDLFPSAVNRIFIWSYYTKLSPVTFHFTDNSAHYIKQTLSLSTLTAVICVTIIFYLAGNLHLSRQEM